MPTVCEIFCKIFYLYTTTHITFFKKLIDFKINKMMDNKFLVLTKYKRKVKW